MSMLIMRLLFGALTATALVVASFPMLILVNLAEGGTGYGMCAGGITACDMAYLTPVELLVRLLLLMMVLVALVRAIVVIWGKISPQTQGQPPTRA